MNLKRRPLCALLLALSLLLGMAIPASAAETTNADRLNRLGLFKGTNHGYALDETATRMQGLIMLTRLLGEENKALNSDFPCQFTDVASEKMKHYVSYAYEQGYTSGTTETTFSPANKIGFKHYVTFLLRALGYDDKAGDFSFSTSLNKAAEIGMMDAASAQRISAENPTFYRGDLVGLSVAALTTKLKNSTVTLAEYLADRGDVFTFTEGEQEGVIGNGSLPYTYEAKTGPIVPAPNVPNKPAQTSSISRKTAAYNLPSGTVSADVITVDLSDPKIEVKSAMVDNQLGKTANFSDIVKASGAQVVIDGNFFEAYNASKLPIGHVMVDGTFLYGVSGLSAAAFTHDGRMMIGRPSLFFFVEGGGRSWACYEINSRGQAAATSVLYNPGYGSSVTLTCDGVITTVEDGVIRDSYSAAAGTVAQIPANGFVMFFGNVFTSYDYYRTPVVGTQVEVHPKLMKDDGSGFTLEGVTSILSGAPRLVEHGAICTTLEEGFQEKRFTTLVSSRTAVGQLADGKLVIVSTSAASIQQMRELMLQLGCIDAINLDGGASTALAYQGKIIRNAGRPLTTTLQIFVH